MSFLRSRRTFAERQLDMDGTVEKTGSQSELKDVRGSRGHSVGYLP